MGIFGIKNFRIEYNLVLLRQVKNIWKTEYQSLISVIFSLTVLKINQLLARSLLQFDFLGNNSFQSERLLPYTIIYGGMIIFRLYR